MANTKSKITKNATKAAITENIPATKDIAILADEKKQYRVKKNLDPNMIVTVKNGFHGSLIYKSKRTNERFEWEEFGDEQDMDLQELKNARNSSNTFFANNWFLIDDPEVLEYLGVTEYYKNALNYESFDSLFDESPAEIKNKIALLSNGQKKSVIYRAKELIASGAIDSIKVINALEEALATELIDREF